MNFLAKWFLDILLPEKCLGCNMHGEIMCDVCISKIRKAERETEHDMYACFDYRDPLAKKAIWNLKYYNRRGLGQKLGNLLYDTLLEEIADMKMYKGEGPFCVIPVPLSPKRSRARGYNQAAIIARHFCSSGEKNMFRQRNNVVIKRSDTLPQARILNRTKRLANIRNAFEVKNPHLVRGQTCIVIDDVTTTGGTILEIMKTLKKAGAKKVVGFAIAH